MVGGVVLNHGIQSDSGHLHLCFAEAEVGLIEIPPPPQGIVGISTLYYGYMTLLHSLLLVFLGRGEGCG